MFDPLSDKSPSFSPYVYCANNPIKCIDPDGRDVGNREDWAQFGKSCYKALTAMLTFGFQITDRIKIGTTPIGLNLNSASVDVIGVLCLI